MPRGICGGVQNGVRGCGVLPVSRSALPRKHDVPGAGGLSVLVQGDRRYYPQTIHETAAFRSSRGKGEREFPECGPVRGGVRAAARAVQAERRAVHVRVLEVLSGRLRAWPGFRRGPGPVSGQPAEGLAVWGRDSEQILAAGGLFRGAPEAWRGAGLHFLDGPADGERTEGAGVEPDDRGAARGEISSETGAELRASSQPVQAIRRD